MRYNMGREIQERLCIVGSYTTFFVATNPPQFSQFSKLLTKTLDSYYTTLYTDFKLSN